ncbi:signal peptide peptidase SppA [Prosthecomicrobium pneumaticum]|uniref:Protease-4 n=1 Tax=Prosthecomicrobium pneumaticum TaxID=81895 RepID=A0A7W9L2S9_9HYPH|nr:signal peptide peptidase SppA [Prosthecomicrobium pneumaticum]MBB5753801.1 protease-4 [Prosthecomicrobium pneumaticum]
MAMDAEQIVDRRRLRRKLSFWRVAAFLLLAIAVAAAVVALAGPDAFGQRSRPHIARITISGFISDDRDLVEMIDSVAKSDAVRGAVVAIDSTGGSTAGGEALYDALRRLSEAKPTVASMRSVGASAAYMAAIATDHIVARRSTITGSIGVIFQYPEVSQALDHLGIKVESIKSAPLKAEPSPFEPTTPEARAVIEALIRDTFDWFVDIVAERRGLDRATTLRLADGRVYSGRQALDAKLVDAIGGEDTAIAWLADEKDVDPALPVVDWKPVDRTGGPFSLSKAAVVWLAEQAGLPPALLRVLGAERLIPSSPLVLDGLLSVWHAPAGLSDAEGAPR